jgi:predicted nucleic acid-binding protein
MLYLDTSVLVPLYISEENSARVQALVRSAQRVGISSLSDLEFHSAIAKLARLELITREDARRTLEEFSRHCDQNIYAYFPLDHMVFRIARRWLARLETPLRSLDTLHLAIAWNNGLQLLSADRALIRSAHRLGASARTP